MEESKIKSIAIVWGSLESFIKEINEHVNQERINKKDKYVNLGLMNISSVIKDKNIPFEEKEIRSLSSNVVMIQCSRKTFLPFHFHEDLVFKNGAVCIYSKDDK